MAMVTEFRNENNKKRNELDSFHYILKGCKTIYNWPSAVLCGRGWKGGWGDALKYILDLERSETSRCHCMGASVHAFIAAKSSELAFYCIKKLLSYMMINFIYLHENAVNGPSIKYVRLEGEGGLRKCDSL